MSVRVMTLVFNCKMPEIKTAGGKTVPDSTAKFVLLALADHASDDGEGCYPGVRRMCQKTGFSTSTVCYALNALRHNGFTRLEGRSRRDTYNYTILVSEIERFQWPKSDDSSQRNPSVSTTETNPSETISQPSINARQETKTQFRNPSWDVAHGLSPDPAQAAQEARLGEVPLRLEKGLKLGQFPTTLSAQSVYKWILRQEDAGQSLDTFIRYVMDDPRRKEFAFVYHRDPTTIRRDWDRAHEGAAALPNVTAGTMKTPHMEYLEDSAKHPEKYKTMKEWREIWAKQKGAGQ